VKCEWQRGIWGEGGEEMAAGRRIWAKSRKLKAVGNQGGKNRSLKVEEEKILLNEGKGSGTSGRLRGSRGEGV